MAKYEWGSDMNRWMIQWDVDEWQLCSPMCETEQSFPTFAEAHAAYLDAVTCDVPSTWSGVKYRCVRSKGHTGFHMRPRP